MLQVKIDRSEMNSRLYLYNIGVIYIMYIIYYTIIVQWERITRYTHEVANMYHKIPLVFVKY